MRSPEIINSKSLTRNFTNLFLGLPWPPSRWPNVAMERPTLTIGIDPGFTGALAAIQTWPGHTARQPKIIDVVDMPTKMGLDGRATVDAYEVAFWLTEVLPEDRANPQILAAIEKVTASPQMGVVSAFRFGEGYGTVTAVATYAGLLIKHAVPSVWKPAAGLSNDKRLSCAMAVETFSNGNSFIKLAKHDGRAEACLLALFIAERFGPSMETPKSLAN